MVKLRPRKVITPCKLMVQMEFKHTQVWIQNRVPMKYTILRFLRKKNRYLKTWKMFSVEGRDNTKAKIDIGGVVGRKPWWQEVREYVEE